MSIAAEVVGVSLKVGGTVTLHLGPLDGDGPGQDSLEVVNPPKCIDEFMASVVGLKIWGGSSEIRVRDTKWADRIGYTRIRLVT